ncbi:hypothetical protein Tco_1506175 [Tanacetum coccineum]
MVAFLGSLPVPLQHNLPSYSNNFIKKGDGDGKWYAKVRTVDSYGNVYDQGSEKNFSKTLSTNDFEAGSSSLLKRTRQHETVEEAMLPRVHHEFLHWGTSNRAAKSKYNTNLERLLPKQIYASCIIDWGVLNNMNDTIEEMLEIKVYEIGGDEEIFISEAWRRAFDIREPIYADLCHEFYTTYEFDEAVTDEDLMSKKDDGFETYFLKGLRNDDHFNVNRYWSEISSENALILSRNSVRTIRKPILRVLQKMITYGLCQRTTGYDKVQRNELWLMSKFEAKHLNGYANVAWLIENWLKRKGVGSQKENMICCGQFITKIARRANLLIGEVMDGLSAPIYCRSLDTLMGGWVVWRFNRGDYAPLSYDEEQDEE